MPRCIEVMFHLKHQFTGVAKIWSSVHLRLLLKFEHEEIMKSEIFTAAQTAVSGQNYIVQSEATFQLIGCWSHSGWLTCRNGCNGNWYHLRFVGQKTRRLLSHYIELHCSHVSVHLQRGRLCQRRKEWSLNWLIHCCTFGQVACESTCCGNWRKMVAENGGGKWWNSAGMRCAH